MKGNTSVAVNYLLSFHSYNLPAQVLQSAISYTIPTPIIPTMGDSVDKYNATLDEV